MNYEKYMNSEYGSNLDWATGIETVAATSLGVEGWALHDVGTLEEEKGRVHKGPLLGSTFVDAAYLKPQ